MATKRKNTRVKVTMLSERDKKSLLAAKKRLEKCGGDCKHCDRARVIVSKVGLYYAWTCDALPENWQTPIADSLNELHAEAMEIVTFELS